MLQRWVDTNETSARDPKQHAEYFISAALGTTSRLGIRLASMALVDTWNSIFAASVPYVR